MFLKKVKYELKLLKAFQKLFFDEKGKLYPEAEIVLAFLRDEAGARGELGANGFPYFYDAQNRFDVHAAAFLLGKRRMFDLIVKYLALKETEVFCLSQNLMKEDDVQKQLEV